MKSTMFIIFWCIAILMQTALCTASAPGTDGDSSEALAEEAPAGQRSLRRLQNGERELTLNVLNLSYNQPFSTFFVMVHNAQATPMFALGEAPSNYIARLAEYGQPRGLENYYRNIDPTGVKCVERYSRVTGGGETSQIKAKVSIDYPLVSLAAMCENTNDGFVALNAVRVGEGGVYDEPGLDAGSEVNDESCDSVPGPACAGRGDRVGRSFNGEGYVHVHRGVAGVGDLGRDLDWKNPMMRVTVTE